MAMLSGNSGLSHEMNVTPLIDVLLVLLIIFMVITPITPRGLDALVPQPAKTQTHSDDTRAVIVQVLPEGENGSTLLKINDENTTWDTIGGRLHAIFAPRAEKVLFIKGDDQVTFDNIAQVIDIAHTAGVDRVGLMTKRIAD